MTRLSKVNEELRKGAWDAEEDEKLRKYVETYGTGNWRSVGKKAGLQRCGKSCRLRWTNYLRPDIRHGSFTLEEEDLIVKLHAAHGSRWSLIAAQMPGRTDNDIKNYWNTRLKKKLCDMGIDPVTHKPIAEVLRDLAGTMAQSSGAGNQLAEEAARRCFRDSLVNRAVQDFGKNNPALVSRQFMNRTSMNVVHENEENLILAQGIKNHPDIAQKFSPGNSVYNSHSRYNSSNSTEDALSRRSASPISPNLEHSNQHMCQTNNADQGQSNQEASGTVVETSYVQMDYLTSTQMPSKAYLISFQESASSENNQGVAGPSTSVQPIRTDSTHWSTSRSALPQVEQLPHFSQFASALQNQLSNQSHSNKRLKYIQGSDVRKPQEGCISGDGQVDIKINLGFNQQAGSLQHENFGYRSFSGPLMSPITSGNSVMDVASTQHADLSEYPGHSPIICPYNSANLISPQTANHTNWHSPSLAGTPTGLRLHEFEVPSPRMVLWDYQE